MNHILKTFILTSILLFSFSVVSAANIKSPLNCCKLNDNVTLEGATYNKGDVVGNGETCILKDVTTTPDKVTIDWGLICLLGSIGAVAHWIFVILMVVSPLMIILGAYFIMTAGAKPENVASGKNYIIWAVVGLLVGLFSNAIPALVSSLIGS